MSRRIRERERLIIAELDQINQANEELSQTIDLLRSFDMGDILVPFGPHAFFPGEIIQNDQVFMNLGQDIFAVRRPEQCIKSLMYRQKLAAKAKLELDQLLKSVQLSKNGMPQDVTLEGLTKESFDSFSGKGKAIKRPDNFIEIVEPYESSEEDDRTLTNYHIKDTTTSEAVGNVVVERDDPVVLPTGATSSTKSLSRFRRSRIA